MEEKQVFLKLCGYEVPFIIVKQGIRRAYNNSVEGAEERYLLTNDSGIEFEANKPYIFNIGYDKTFICLSQFVINNRCYYLIGRFIEDILDTTATKTP